MTTPTPSGEETKNLDVVDALIYKRDIPVGIDETIFADYLHQRYGLLCVGEDFYRSEGKVADENVRALIQQTIEQVGFNTNLDSRTRKLLNAAKNHLRIPTPKPKENLIHPANGTIIVSANKFEFSNEKEFTLNRLNVDYNPNDTSCPVWTETFLPSLLEPLDIRCLQEFFGYCLIPTLRGETFMLILGVKGGEGKSRIGLIMKEILGNSCYYGGKLGDLQENRFTTAVLENKLLFIDDDLKSEKLKDAKSIASIVTTPYQKYERKGRDQVEFCNYCRLMALGNVALSTLYDHSDALPRRMLLLKTKPKPPNRVDDKELIDKLKAEKVAIFNWALVGLQRLLKNHYNFTISPRSRQAVEDLREESDNIRGFLRDDSVVLITHEDTDSAPTAQLYSEYQEWCCSVAEKATTEKAFSTYLKNFAENLGISYSEKLPGSRKRGYKGIRITKGGEINNEIKMYSTLYSSL